MLITLEHIKIYRAVGACDVALEWAEAAQRQYHEAPVMWRYWLARNATTPPEVLTWLKDDSSILVRCGLAANSHTPPAVLATMRSDPSRRVREWLACNPSAPPS